MYSGLRYGNRDKGISIVKWLRSILMRVFPSLRLWSMKNDPISNVCIVEEDLI